LIAELKDYIIKRSDSKTAETAEYRFIEKFYESTNLFINSYDRQKFKNWSKLQGYISLRLVKDFIDNELKSMKSQYITSRLNSFIKGFPTEFDLLILKKENTNSFENIYDPNDVKTIIEVKTSGIIAGKDEIERKFKRIKDDIEPIVTQFSHINFVYITLFERGKPKNPTSLDYLGITKKSLYPYKSFCIFDVVEWDVIDKELTKFIDEIK
jgi:hypothetical protein